MILNTGQRTDIPAFYSEWFFNRIKEGFVWVRNPYDPQRVTEYRLDPELIDVIVFCTKDPGPMLDRLDELKGFRQFWHVTITPYGKEIEPNVPEKSLILERFRKLSALVGPEAVTWRYDPIFINERYTVESHLKNFERMCSELKGYTGKVVISFIDLYAKTKKNFPEVREVTEEERRILGREIARIASGHSMKVYTCHEGNDMKEFGIDTNGCMTRTVIEQSLGITLENLPNIKLRENCSCLIGNDIGAYNTCLHGCRYCYANYDMEIVRRNAGAHDPESPLLIGHLQKEDRLYKAAQRSNLSDLIGLGI